MPDHLDGNEEAVAALLADPCGNSGGVVEGLEPALRSLQIGPTTSLGKLLHILARNKVPLLAISSEQGRLQAMLCAHPDFQRAQAVEQAHYDRLRREYLEAQKLWRQVGIADVLIKSGGAPPSFPYQTSNLDVLVQREDGDRARQILRRHGYVELRNVEENHKYLFRRFHHGEEALGLHVHEHVGWYASFLDEDALWVRARAAPDDPTLIIPSVEDIFLTTVAHFFYEDKEVKLSDLATVQRCLRQGLDWGYTWAVVERRGWRDGLSVALLICAYLGQAWYGASPLPTEQLARAEEVLTLRARRQVKRYLQRETLCWPFRIPFLLSKAYFYRRLWREESKSVWGRLVDLAAHTLQGLKLRLRLHSQPSMLICFSGIDGSGKTAQARLLQKAFEGCHIRARYVWSRSGSSRFVGLFTQLARRTPAAGEPPVESEEARIARRKRLLQRPLIRTAWTWLTALDLAAKYLIHVRVPLWRGDVVICDRYVYDTWAEWAAYLGDDAEICRSWAARVLRRLAPQPKAGFLLDISPQAAADRASTAPPRAFLADLVDAYRRLASSFAVTVADAERPLAELSDEIVYRVLTAYFDRYWTLVNALFCKNPRPMPAVYQKD